MMLVFAVAFYIQVAPGCIRKRFKEMKEHFRRHIPYFLAAEIGIPNHPRAAAKIKQHFGFGFVHRQGKTIPLYAAFIAQCQCKRFAQCNAGVFYRMMFVNMQVAF